MSDTTTTTTTTTTTPRPRPSHDGHTHTETISLEQKVLEKNDLLAEQNRQWLAGRGILALNVTSSPGAGKTTLLERTIRELTDDRPVAVIEGDQETLLDAERIRAAGARAVQVNTGAGCHLDADMVHRALHALDPEPASLLFIENVGNLVCPALFDLGEHSKVVVISVTEGADKPLKYPHMFAAAGLVIINKIDLCRMWTSILKSVAATHDQLTRASIFCRCRRRQVRVSRHGTTGSLRR